MKVNIGVAFAYFYHLRVNISVCYSQSLTFSILASLQAYALAELSLKWWSSCWGPRVDGGLQAYGLIEMLCLT